jgi:hypothetical protein
MATMTMLRSRWLGSALSAALLVATVAPATAGSGQKRNWWQGAPQREAEPFQWTGTLARGATLEVKNINGSVRAELASGDEAEVVAVRRGRKDDPEDVRIEVNREGDVVTVCARYPNPSGGLNDCEHQQVQDCDVSVEFTVRVPAGVAFAPQTVNGSIEATGLRGPVDAVTVNGSIDLSTTAVALARTVNGSIQARMGQPGDDESIDFETVNGRIELEMPRDLNADLDARAANGSVRSDFAVEASRHSSDGRRRLVGRIGEGGSRLRLSTVNGSIELAAY